MSLGDSWVTMGLLVGKPVSISEILYPLVAVGPCHNTFHCRYSHEYWLNMVIYIYLLLVTTSNLSYYWSNYSELDMASQSHVKIQNCATFKLKHSHSRGSVYWHNNHVYYMMHKIVASVFRSGWLNQTKTGTKLNLTKKDRTVGYSSHSFQSCSVTSLITLRIIQRLLKTSHNWS
jgi:hypothetical protein